MKYTLYNIMFSLFSLTLSINYTNAQDIEKRVLNPEAFLEIIRLYHPIAKQSELVNDIAKANLRVARGGWDPKIYSNYDTKNYEGENYYNYFENKVSIPVWYGLEIKGTYDFISGTRVNPESKIPNEGLGALGITLPIGRNLFLDKQRATLFQARIFQEASKQQQLEMLNDLFLNALVDYYNWSLSYQSLLVLENAQTIAKTRYLAVIRSSILGDRPFIDTVEALTQLQNRQIQLANAKLNFNNTSLELSNYLWMENKIPLPFDPNLVPAILNSDFLNMQIDLSKMEEMISNLEQNQPAIVNNKLKTQSLELNRRLQTEELKPVINLNYNALRQQFNFNENNINNLNNNYKLGFNFYMPLTFAEGRAKVKIANLEIKNNQYIFDQKLQEFTNKIKAAFNELLILQSQTKLYSETTNSFKQLFDGETIRFRNGESSLFLVNNRENQFLDAQLKLAEFQSKYYQTEAKLKWAAGTISVE